MIGLILWTLATYGASAAQQNDQPKLTAEEIRAAGDYLLEVSTELSQEIDRLPRGVFQALPVRVSKDLLVSTLRNIKLEPSTNVPPGTNPLGMSEPRTFFYAVDKAKPPGVIRAPKQYFLAYREAALRVPSIPFSAADYMQGRQNWLEKKRRYFLKWRILHESLHLFGYREDDALPVGKSFGPSFVYLSYLRESDKFANVTSFKPNENLSCGVGTDIQRADVNARPGDIPTIDTLSFAKADTQTRVKDCQAQLGALASQEPTIGTHWQLVGYRLADPATFTERSFWLNKKSNATWLRAKTMRASAATYVDEQSCEELGRVAGDDLGIFRAATDPEIKSAIKDGLYSLQILDFNNQTSRARTSSNSTAYSEILCIQHKN